MKGLIRSMSILIILLMISSLGYTEKYGPLIDDAGLLTDEQYWELYNRAEQVASSYQCDVVIITMDDMATDDAYEYAKYLRKEFDYGYGADKSVILLLLSMGERDYALFAQGYGNIAFTDHGKDVMLDDNILPLLKKDKYYEAFSAYINLSEEYLSMARAGSPFDINTDPNYGKIALHYKVLITLLLPLIIAFGICSLWKNKMKTAKLAIEAGNYIGPGGLSLTNKQDIFLYRRESVRKIESESSGGTSVDSSGSSGRSGKF